MTMYSSSLSNIDDTLVLDTSVLINLHASGFGDQILAAIPNAAIVPAIAAAELDTDLGVGRGQPSFLKQLVVAGKVEIHELTEAEYQTYHELISVSPTLDDGEAAAISISIARGFRAVIDERKGRTRLLTLNPTASPAWSLDLIRHPAVIAALADADEALYQSLRIGRMRIPVDAVQAVISIIGADRAAACTCLPGFRDLFLRQALAHHA